MPSDLSEIRRELAALRSHVAELQLRLNQADLRTSHAEPPAKANGIEVVQTEPQRLERIEAEFRNEPSDPAWSQSTAARVRAAVAQIGDGVAERLRGLECRSKTCRVELAPAETEPVDDALPRIVALLGDAFTSADASHVDQGDGLPVGVLFLSH